MKEDVMPNVPYQSIPEMLLLNAARFSERPAISYKKDGRFISLTYGQFYMRVLMAARGLRKAGMQPGDNVVIFSENRAGWAISDFAIQCAQGVSVPIYATNTSMQAAYVINHCQAKIVFVSTQVQYQKLLAVREQIPGVELVISYERFLGDKSFPVYTLYQLSEISHPLTDEEQQTIENQIKKIQSDDLLTVIYTSGTTGTPKGVELTQENMLLDASFGLQKLGGLDPDQTFLSFLPLSHVLERTAGYHAALMSGCHVAFAESVDKVLENIQEIKPTVMVSVPRLFEKIYSRIHETVHQMSPLRRRLFHRAITTGREYVSRRYINPRPINSLLRLEHKLLDRLVFHKIRQRFGGKLSYFISGGAPLDKTINEFMWAIGIPTFEGYGLTETSPAITLNGPGQVRFGSVGTPLEQTEVKLAADGELLVRGPQVMRGYYKDPAATAQVCEDGWFCTGDIARIDEDGFVYIIDRKKEIIVTAAGKNIAPQPLENELKLDKYISQAFVYGDKKPYLVALLTPNMERLIEVGREKNLDYFDSEELVANHKVHELFAQRIAQLNEKLPPYETIKKFALLAHDFSLEGGELTPTLKLKRKQIYEKYKDKIERLYLPNEQRPNHDNGGTA
jgi:long-chain acyl-CoA synthetase